LEVDRRPFRCRWVTDEETDVIGVPPVEIGLGCRSDTDFIGLSLASFWNSFGLYRSHTGLTSVSSSVSYQRHIGITCTETDIDFIGLQPTSCRNSIGLYRSPTGLTSVSSSVSYLHHIGITCMETDTDFIGLQPTSCRNSIGLYRSPTGLTSHRSLHRSPTGIMSVSYRSPISLQR
jgi:hypothetical protein